MSRRIRIVIPFGWYAKRLKRGVLVSRRHSLVAGLVARIHCLTDRNDGVLAPILGSHKVKLDGQRHVEQRRTLAVLALDDLAVSHARQDAQAVL